MNILTFYIHINLLEVDFRYFWSEKIFPFSYRSVVPCGAVLATEQSERGFECAAIHKIRD